MGNTPPSTTGSFRLSNGDHSYKVQVGSALVEVEGRKVKRKCNGETTESWRMSYEIGWSTDCSFVLTKTKGDAESPNHHDEKLNIKIEDFGLELAESSSSVTVKRAETGISFLHFANRGFGVTYFPIPTITTANAQGGITETMFNLYWRKKGRCRVLMVCELKKKSEDEKPHMVTVSHYFAYIGNGTEAGLSVALKSIGVSDDGRLDFAVDGPREHPATALFYMFDQFYRSRAWPTSCPHCANSMSSQSERKDSDKGNVPIVLLHGPKQNAAGVLANDGVINGNNNGNLTIRKLIFGLIGRR